MSFSDALLEFFLEQIELNNTILSITLYMNGISVQGQIIQSKTYYDKLSTLLDDIASQNAKKLSPEKIQEFETYRENLRQFMADRASDSKYDSEYIHIEDATIKRAGTDIEAAYLWRGKVSSVDSFSVGNTSYAEEEDDQE